MKNKYFERIENKYVFNLSKIVWHCLIAVASLAIIVFIAIFLWSVLPAAHKEADKQPYPEKRQYPTPVKVTASELLFGESRQVEDLPDTKGYAQADTSNIIQQPIEDLKGKTEFEALMDTLKILIPPALYNWRGDGYYIYPQGERYWTAYHQEIFRQWISTDGGGVEGRLNVIYERLDADNFSLKTQVLRRYINLIKMIPGANRLTVLNNLLDYTNKSIIPLIDYATTIIHKFSDSQKPAIIERILAGYYIFFNQNVNSQKEATELFLPLLSEISGEQQATLMLQYYKLYVGKNYQRDIEIAKIENEYNNIVEQIESQYALDQAAAEATYLAKKLAKHDLRLKSLIGIAGGILLIVLIATILAFLSIQRSVKKIEQKVSPPNE